MVLRLMGKPRGFRIALPLRQLLHHVCTAGGLNIVCSRFQPRNSVILGLQELLHRHTLGSLFEDT
jgi:hypothetical protein